MWNTHNIYLKQHPRCMHHILFEENSTLYSKYLMGCIALNNLSNLKTDNGEDQNDMQKITEFR